jgi:hypothetical protein
VSAVYAHTCSSQEITLATFSAAVEDVRVWVLFLFVVVVAAVAILVAVGAVVGVYYALSYILLCF